MSRILVLSICLCFATNVFAQAKTCQGIVEEGVKLDVAQIEADILKKIDQSKKEFAAKFIKVMNDIFEKVDEYRGIAIPGSDPQKILDAAVYRYKAGFDGVFCQVGGFKPAPTGRGDLAEQEKQFSDNRSGVVNNGGCAGYAYYQMFVHAGSFARLKFGRVYPFDSENEVHFGYGILNHDLEALFSEASRRYFIGNHVEIIFSSAGRVVGEQIINRVQSELRSRYCPENLSENFLKGHVWRAVDEATEQIASKFIASTPKRWAKSPSK